MSKIEELIKEYCLDGVEYKKLDDVTTYERPDKFIVKNTEYNDAFKIPVLTAGKAFILGYTDETENIYLASAEEPVIIFDDFLAVSKWVDFPFKVKSSAMKFIHATDDIDIRYLFYTMQCINYTPTDHARQWISTYSQFEIPVPPLPVQQEIVRILDSFTELQNELQKELEERKKQYTWLEEELITGPRYTVKKLSECATVERGKRLVRKQLSSDKNGGYPVYQNALEPLGYYSESNRRSNIPFVIAAGAAGKLGYSYTEFWAADDCYTIVNNRNVYGRYLYYAIEIQSKYLKDHVRMGSIPRIAKSFVEETQIFLPDYQQQVIIANKLDTLFQLIDKTIPSEIALRQQQYSYYRDKLLSFPRKEA